MEIVLLVLLVIVLIEVTYLVAGRLRLYGVAKTVTSPVFVDTSVLIDGRIVAVAESGFIGRTLYVPRSVVGELQYLADNADHDKRARARYGLDIITELQQLPRVSVEIYQDGSTAKEGVDERLLALAKQHDGAVCTIDFNLNKVATVEGIEVLNINDLAKKLRMAHLPGERMTLELTQKGQDSHQAIGHLEDGTMVVVEQASQKLGSIVEVEFIRSLQTAAGKMLFARLYGAEPKQRQSNKTKVAPKLGTKETPKGRAPSVVTKKQKNTPVKKTQPARRGQTRKDHEASLIELVNRQD